MKFDHPDRVYLRQKNLELARRFETARFFTDGVHLISDSIQNLHAFAESIGLKRHYFHGVRKKHPHYDLTNPKVLLRAIAAGARVVSSKEIVRLCKEWHD
jgi:hypothetical protein